jgi:hypothetical protein
MPVANAEGAKAGGEHVGGCDDTVAANKSGKLKELLGGVGVKV